MESYVDEPPCSDRECVKIKIPAVMETIKNGQPTQPSQSNISRLKLKKLKSPNETVFVYDPIYHYLWRVEKPNNEEILVRVDGEMYDTVRGLNGIKGDRFIEQPLYHW